MPTDLKRYQQSGDLHFVTFSCYHRLAYLGTASVRELFERSLEAIRLRYEFVVTGYVVMPEHVHLLVSGPLRGTLARALQALKAFRGRAEPPTALLAAAVLRFQRSLREEAHREDALHAPQSSGAGIGCKA